jgi:hypothetical protein
MSAANVLAYLWEINGTFEPGFQKSGLERSPLFGSGASFLYAEPAHYLKLNSLTLFKSMQSQFGGAGSVVFI